MATVHVGANADPHPSITMHGSPYNNCEHLIGSGAGSIVLPKRQNYELSFSGGLSGVSAPGASA